MSVFKLAYIYIQLSHWGLSQFVILICAWQDYGSYKNVQFTANTGQRGCRSDLADLHVQATTYQLGIHLRSIATTGKAGGPAGFILNPVTSY